MSIAYIDRLNLDQLREIGQILYLPDYESYEDDDELRAYVKKFLTTKNQVRKAHLNKIKTTKEEIERLTENLRVLMDRRRKSNRVEAQVVDQKIEVSLEELKQCQNRLRESSQKANVICESLLSPEFITELREYSKRTPETSIQELVSGLMTENVFVIEMEKESAREFDEYKAKSIQALEECQELTRVAERLAGEAKVRESGRLNMLLEELEEKKRELEMRQGIINGLNIRNQIEINKVSLFERERQSLNDRITELTRDLAECKDQNRGLNSEVQSLTIRVDTCSEELLALQDKHDLLQQTINATAIKGDEQRKLNECGARIRELETLLANLENAKNSCESKVEQGEKCGVELKRATIMVKSFEERLLEAESKLNNVQNKLEYCLRNNSEITSRFEGELKNCKEQGKVRGGKINGILKQLNEKNQEIERLKQVIKEEQTRCDERVSKTAQSRGTGWFG